MLNAILTKITFHSRNEVFDASKPLPFTNIFINKWVIKKPNLRDSASMENLELVVEDKEPSGPSNSVALVEVVLLVEKVISLEAHAQIGIDFIPHI